MVADVTETRNVIPSLKFKTCMTIKSYSKLFKFVQQNFLRLANIFC